MIASKSRNRRAGVERLSEDFRQLGGDAKQIASDKYSSAEHAVRSYVQDQPLKALLIAVGAGALLGLFFRR